VDEMLKISVTLNNQEKLNDEIFRLVSKERGLDSNDVRKTGVT
jgi:hypothetical protein